MAGYVDPFEAFKKKKEDQQPKAPAVPVPGAAPAQAPAVSADEFAIGAPGEGVAQHDGKPAGFGTGRASLQPASTVTTTALKGKVASIMQEAMQGVSGAMEAAALPERKIQQEKPLEPGGAIEAALVKPAGMESHRIAKGESTGEIVKPAGLERTRLETDAKEKNEAPVQRPSNFSKY